MLGETLAQIGFTAEIVPPYVSVKEAVFPFNKFREFDPVLGPEMRSTGEVMGIDDSFGAAFLKSQLAADNALPRDGAVFMTVNDCRQARGRAARARVLASWVSASSPRAARRRSCARRRARRPPCSRCTRAVPNGVDLILNGDVQLLVNTPLGKHAQYDDERLRQAAIANRVPYTTTLSAANAACEAIASRDAARSPTCCRCRSARSRSDPGGPRVIASRRREGMWAPASRLAPARWCTSRRMSTTAP